MKHYKSLHFCQSLVCQALLHEHKATYEDFLAMVLSGPFTETFIRAFKIT